MKTAVPHLDEHEIGTLQSAFGEQSERMAVAPGQEASAGMGDSSFSERVGIMHRETGYSVPMCEEIFDFFQDQGWLAGSRPAFGNNLPAWMAKFVKILEYLRDHPTLTALFAVTRIWDDPVLDDIFQHMTQSEFAKTITVKKIGSAEIALTKAAVNNAVMDAAKYFKTAPRRDQRTGESCRNMTNAQEKIWHPQTKAEVNERLTIHPQKT
jgi:hypothetical protein